MTTAPPGREELVHSISHLLAGHSFALITGGHHEEMASKIVDKIIERLAAKPASSSAQLSELDAASNACLELCSRHGFATGHGDTVADIIREIDAQIGERLAAKPADEGTIPVPKIALDWLNGEAPDADGKWFGECIPQSDVSPKRAYWWRSKFRSMIPALSTTGEPKLAPPDNSLTDPSTMGGDRE